MVGRLPGGFFLAVGKLPGCFLGEVVIVPGCFFTAVAPGGIDPGFASPAAAAVKCINYGMQIFCVLHENTLYWKFNIIRKMSNSPSFLALSILENRTNNCPNVNCDNPSGSISIPFPGGPGSAPASNGVFSSEFITGPSVDLGSRVISLFSSEFITAPSVDSCSAVTILFSSIVDLVSKMQMN